MGTPGLHSTEAGGLPLYHHVPTLGPGVAEAVAALIQTYAARASLADLPPITLEGERWDHPWEEIAAAEPCRGQAGPSEEDLLLGAEWYTCLALGLPPKDARRHPIAAPHPETPEAIVAHEIVHLRWPQLEHGLEFDARVLALLRGAVFPPHTGWSRETRRIMAQTREEARAWGARLIALSRGQLWKETEGLQEKVDP